MALTTAGRDFIAGIIIGTGNAFNATNARLGVGDSATAFAAGQTDLQAATNKLRKIVDSAPTVNVNVMTFVATFLTAEANWVWNEVGVFNAASGGTMLCRVVQSLGTKVSGSWVLTHTVTVS